MPQYEDIDWANQGISSAPATGSAAGNSVQPRALANPTDPLLFSIVKVAGFAVNDPSPNYMGTAVFISNDKLLSAAHVIFNPIYYGSARQGYASHIMISSPIFQIPPSAAGTTAFEAPNAYVQNSAPAADIAVIRLPAAIPAARPLVPQTLSSNTINGRRLRVYGFPSLMPAPSTADGQCNWSSIGMLQHSAPTVDGESGGPMMIANGPTPAFCGIHTSGSGLGANGAGVRFSDALISWINSL